MKILNPIKRSPVNDNRHDPFGWEIIHVWLDAWFTANKLPHNRSLYQRSIHYAYELENRPWLAEIDRRNDIIRWLLNDALALGYEPKAPTVSDSYLFC